jgi:hypothetical protein
MKVAIVLVLLTLVVGCGKSRHELYIETRDQLAEAEKDRDAVIKEVKSKLQKIKTKGTSEIVESTAKQLRAINHGDEKAANEGDAEMKKATENRTAEANTLYNEAEKLLKAQQIKIDTLRAKMESYRD